MLQLRCLPNLFASILGTTSVRRPLSIFAVAGSFRKQTWRLFRLVTRPLHLLTGLPTMGVRLPYWLPCLLHHPLALLSDWWYWHATSVFVIGSMVVAFLIQPWMVRSLTLWSWIFVATCLLGLWAAAALCSTSVNGSRFMRLSLLLR